VGGCTLDSYSTEQLRGYALCMNAYSHVPLARTESCQYVVTLICDIYLCVCVCVYIYIYIYSDMTPESRNSGARAKFIASRRLAKTRSPVNEDSTKVSMDTRKQQTLSMDTR
jgi:hypothetical protein